MTKTDIDSVDKHAIGGSCMYGENVCRCCLKEEEYCNSPLQDGECLAGPAIFRSPAGRAPPGFR